MIIQSAFWTSPTQKSRLELSGTRCGQDLDNQEISMAAMDESCPDQRKSSKRPPFHLHRIHCQGMLDPHWPTTQPYLDCRLNDISVILRWLPDVIEVKWSEVASKIGPSPWVESMRYRAPYLHIHHKFFVEFPTDEN